MILRAMLGSQDLWLPRKRLMSTSMTYSPRRSKLKLKLNNKRDRAKVLPKE
jgi:hypothetical protein